MKKNNFLHIMRNDKFNHPFIKMINNNFDKEEHKFIIIDGLKEKEPYAEKNVKRYITCGRKYNKILKIIFFLIQLPVLYGLLFFNCKKSKKIYFHGLFEPRIIIFLFIFRKFLKKSDWIVWGGDLYCYKKRNYNSFLKKLWYKIEEHVKKNIAYVNTLAPEDYNVAKEYYNIKGKYKRALYMLEEDFLSFKLSKTQEKTEVYIQIGNSADPSNNHYDILNSLEKFKDKNIKIFAVLSYGDKEYAKKVNEYGKNIFGNKFVGMLDFLSKEEYWQYMSKIDILIFNHKRQQGLANIFIASYFEKKIYIRDDISSWNYLVSDIGLKLNSYALIENQTFNEFRNNNSRGNKKIYLNTVGSIDYFRKIWERNFNEV